MKVQVPPLKIQWIKTKLIAFINDTIKENKQLKDYTWVEPFMWSWVVWFNLAWNKAIFSDTNPHIINLYKSIYDKKINSKIVRKFLEKEWNLLLEKWYDYYLEVRSRFNKEWNPLDYLFLNRSCFNWMMRFNSKWWFNVPYCKKDNRFAKAYITKIVNQVHCLEEKMEGKDWIFKCQDYKDTIKYAPENSLIYCDPPYIDRYSDYYNNWTEENEVDLFNLLSNIKGYFVLSTWKWNKYRDNIYIDKLWNKFKIETKEHFYHLWAKENNRNSITEALIKNF